MKEDIVLIDGGVGTSLWEKTENKVPVWRYNIENPAIVKELHEEMAEAGARIVLANTFGANRPNMAGTDYNVPQIVGRAMELAHEALDGKAMVSLGVGPLTGLLKPYGEISKEDAFDYFDEQISAGAAGKPDVIYIQTFMDLEMAKIAARAARKHDDIKLFISMTFAATKRKGPRTLMGNSVQDIIDGLKDFQPDAIGLNCSTGPEETLPIIKEFSELTEIPLIYKPNAGKPTLEGGSQFDYKIFASDVVKAADYPGVKYLGGCCGANAKYIAALRDKLG